MAKDKKSVLVYVDWITTFEELEDDEAGRLIKHFFRYVNDLNPEPPDRLTKLVFEPIKLQLKRDLKVYEATCLKNKENAEKRWQQKNATASIGINNNAKNADTDNDTDTDNDIELSKDNIKKEIKEKFNFRKSLLDLGVSETIVYDWLLVRKRKKAENTKTAFNGLKNQIELTGLSANECIKIASENSWSGFKAIWVENLNKSNGQTFNNNQKSKLAGNIKAAEQLNREIEEKSRNFVSPMHQTG